MTKVITVLKEKPDGGFRTRLRVWRENPSIDQQLNREQIGCSRAALGDRMQSLIFLRGAPTLVRAFCGQGGNLEVGAFR